MRGMAGMHLASDIPVSLFPASHTNTKPGSRYWIWLIGIFHFPLHVSFAPAET